MLQRLCFLLYFAFSFHGILGQSCPGNYDTSIPIYKWGARCYQYISTRMTWNKANDYCKSRGGNLAYVDFDRTQQTIEGLAKTNAANLSELWIGAYEPSDGDWKWVNGRWLKPNWFDTVGYANWAWQQPSGPIWFILDCAYMKTDVGYRWYSAPCNDVNYQYYPICEFVTEQKFKWVSVQYSGNECSSKSVSFSFKWQSAGLYTLQQSSFNKYADSSGSGSEMIYSINNGTSKIASLYQTRITMEKFTQSNDGSLMANETMYKYTMSNLQLSDTGYYGLYLEYVEIPDIYPNTATVKVQPSNSYLATLSVKTPPSTDFVLTVCKKEPMSASSALCESTGSTQKFKTTNFNAFQVVSTSDTFYALCTIPTDLGTPKASIEVTVSGVALEADAVFPQYVYVQRTVSQMLDLVSTRDPNQVYVECQLTGTSPSCLADTSLAKKAIRVGNTGVSNLAQNVFLIWMQMCMLILIHLN